MIHLRYLKLIKNDLHQINDENFWFNISRNNLPEGFIREFKDKVNWDLVSVYSNLSESFIREFQDKVNWSDIFHYQKLSESFIREFEDKVDWYCISYSKSYL